MGQSVSQERVSEAKKQMENALDAITNVWLKDKPFIVGNEITVADLVAATEVEQLGGLYVMLTKLFGLLIGFISQLSPIIIPMKVVLRSKLGLIWLRAKRVLIMKMPIR